MKTLLLFVALATVTQASESLPVSVPTLTIHYDKYVPEEVLYRDLFEQKLLDRVSQRVIESMSKEDYINSFKYQNRINILKSQFNVKLVQRYSDDFRVVINRGTRIELPKNEFCDPIQPLLVLEYIRDSYYFDNKVEKWKEDIEKFVREEAEKNKMGAYPEWGTIDGKEYFNPNLYMNEESFGVDAYGTNNWDMIEIIETSILYRLPEKPQPPKCPIKGLKY